MSLVDQARAFAEEVITSSTRQGTQPIVVDSIARWLIKADCAPDVIAAGYVALACQHTEVAAFSIEKRFGRIASAVADCLTPDEYSKDQPFSVRTRQRLATVATCAPAVRREVTEVMAADAIAFCEHAIQALRTSGHIAFWAQHEAPSWRIVEHQMLRRNLTMLILSHHHPLAQMLDGAYGRLCGALEEEL